MKHRIGEKVFFWSGRASQGNGTIVGIRTRRYLIEPDADAIKGGDYYADGSKEKWGVRTYGVAEYQINTEPKPWYTNF